MFDNKNKSSEDSKNHKAARNLWQEILSESMTKKENEEANIFVFGDKETGKKSLIKMMNKIILEEDEKKKFEIDESSSTYGLINYNLLTVKKILEDETEFISKAGVWIVNELVDKKTFLSIVKPQSILKSMCLIVVDLTKPWTIKENLKRWSNFIYDVASQLILNTKISLEQQEEIKQKSKNKLYYNFIYIYSCKSNKII